MRVVPVLILALLAAPLALAQDNATGNETATPTATPAAEAGPVTFQVQGHQDGSSFYWTVEGATGHNPTLSVPASAKVVFHVGSASGVHNFKVGTEKTSAVINEGDAIDYEWTAPASGTVTYICEIHGASMSGKINVGGAAPAGGSGAPAAAPTPAPTTLTVTAHAEGSDYYWTVEGFSGKNPTITVAPDADITVTVKNANEQTHNFAVGDKASDYVNTPSDVVTFTFHSGAEGTTGEYFCVPHKGLGMKGTLKFAKEIAAAPSGGGSGDITGAINGASADLGTYDAACAGISIPQSSASQEIGGPTTADYVQKCKDFKAGVQSDSEARAPSSADYVIPVSIVLIALGIVGVVWVHKFYKP